MAVRVTKDNFEDTVLKNDNPVIVDFYSDSCVACKMLAPALGEIEDNYEDKISVVKVNTNYDIELCDKYGIRSNPTMLLFKSGEEVDRRIGAATPKELTEWVLQYI